MVEFVNLARRMALYQSEFREAVDEVMDSGWFILGKQLERFEQEYADYIHTRHCVGVGNGLDALTLIYRAYLLMGSMKPGDEVIVPANTYIASILSITENQLVPVLVEPNPDTLQIDDSLIEEKITVRTRSIMIVHLYGRCAYTENIGRLCQKYNLILVEDNAQAHGCRFRGCMTGSLGHAAGHSFYPTKNLGAWGDAGAVTTDDEQLAEIIRAMMNYGSVSKYIFHYKGRNSRMDEMQAAVLRVGLRHLDESNNHRREIAALYHHAIHNKWVRLPALMPDESDVWHIYSVFSSRRDELRKWLEEKGIETQIHYPVPPHHQRCYGEWGSISLPVTEKIHAEQLSLPIGPELTREEVDEVIGALNDFD